ncbi:uncharacterized protein LOC144144464 [Haemaphysalis longicornis]
MQTFTSYPLGPDEHTAATALLMPNMPPPDASKECSAACTELVAKLLKEIMLLKKKVVKLEAECRKLKSQLLAVDSLDNSVFKFYTGLANKGQFDALYGLVKDNAERMMYPWNDQPAKETGRDRELSKREELFLVLFRLRTGSSTKETARNFGVSEATVSRTFCAWINLLDKQLSAMTTVPTLEQVKENLPESFKFFPNTRIVLDCTEVRIQKSTKLTAQRQTYSPYKHYNTFKALVGVTPDGYVSFVPDLWGGHTSDTEVVQKSGILEILQPGDGVMVDKGFRLENLVPPGVTVHIPPFKKAPQFSREQVGATRKLASARIHVERVIRRIKEYHFFDKVIPINMLDISSSIFRTCAFLCNFQPPIMEVREDEAL